MGGNKTDYQSNFFLHKDFVQILIINLKQIARTYLDNIGDNSLVNGYFRRKIEFFTLFSTLIVIKSEFSMTIEIFLKTISYGLLYYIPTFFHCSWTKRASEYTLLSQQILIHNYKPNHIFRSH